MTKLTTEVGKDLTHTTTEDDRLAMKYAIRPFLISNAVVIALMAICFYLMW